MKDLPVTSIQALHERIKAVRGPIAFQHLCVNIHHREIRPVKADQVSGRVGCTARISQKIKTNT